MARAPERLGRYLLFDVIASGGMARVHLGRLEGPVGFSRAVAIKRLHPHLATEREFVAMFMDEAKLAARIAHPNVVPVFDVVALPEELFLVMDYVPGESLARLVAASRPTPAIAVALAVDVLEGLHGAHEAKSDAGQALGIVHRDVSPQNVIVGSDGLARVLDFGIAWALERVQSTREGQLKGKLKYMAPEQLSGKGVDRRTDVYSVGVVLWEMLAGRPLFEGTSEANTFALVSRGALQPPSAFAEGIPSEVDAAVMKALSLDPGARPATARDMATELAQIGPMAGRREIAEWVDSVARDALHTRAAKVREVTSYDDAAPTAISTEAASRPSVPAEPVSREPVALASKPGSRATVAALIGISAALLIGFVFMTVALVQRSRAAEAPSPPPKSSSSVTTTLPTPPPPPMDPEPALPESSSVPEPSGKKPAAKPPNRASDCNPPYTLDRDGVRVPKRHCYK